MMNQRFLVSLLGLWCCVGWSTAAASTAAELIAKGDVHDALFEPDKALTYYLPAEKLTPKDADLLVKLARQYVYRMNGLSNKAAKLGSARTAVAYAERSVKEAPKSGDAHLSVAICYGKLATLLGNRDKIKLSSKIKAAAERAVQLDPQNDYAWHLLGRWHQALAGVGGVSRSVAKLIYGGLPKASYGEAERCLRKAMALNPDRLIHPIELGRTYAVMGRAKEARRLIQRGLAMPNREFDDPETKQRGRGTLRESL